MALLLPGNWSWSAAWTSVPSLEELAWKTALTFLWDATRPNQPQGKRESQKPGPHLDLTFDLLGSITSGNFGPQRCREPGQSIISFPSRGCISMPFFVILTWEKWRVGLQLTGGQNPPPSLSLLTFLLTPPGASSWSTQGVATSLCGRNGWRISVAQAASSALLHSVPATQPGAGYLPHKGSRMPLWCRFLSPDV